MLFGRSGLIGSFGRVKTDVLFAMCKQQDEARSPVFAKGAICKDHDIESKQIVISWRLKAELSAFGRL